MLTDKEKEIALECARKGDLCVEEGLLVVSRGDVIDMFDDFLSRIRAEQRPYMWECSGCGRETRDLAHDAERLKIGGYRSCCPERNMIPLFTTPPGDPECKDLDMIKRMMETGTADSFMSLTDEQKRMAFAVGVHESTLRKKLSDSCSGLVEALEKLSRLGNEPYLGNSVGNRIAQEALTNHAKRTKGEE